MKARFPANNAQAAELKRVAVAGFGGPEGDYFAYALEAMLSNAEFDGRRYFSLVGSGARDVPPDRAVEFGRRVGAEGVYSGMLREADFEDYPYEERTSRCVEKNAEGKCVRKEVLVKPCVRREFNMDVVVSLAEVRTGEVVYSARKSGDTSASWCRGDIQPYSDSDMMDGVLNRILAEIRPDIAPYNKVLQATVIEKTDGLSEGDAARFKAAVKLADNGNIGDACRQWDELKAANPNHPGAVYNVGVCAEANGDFDGALALYEQASRLSLKPDSDIAESIARAKNLIAARQELRRLKAKGKRG
ncbi:hypothetical protein GCM10008941_09030 [Rhizomicrobium palustre]